MLRQAVSLFTYRKKSTGLLILLIALVAFLMMSIAPLFSAIIDITFEGFVEETGRHHAVFFDLTEAQLRQLEQTAAVDQIGIVKNYGSYAIKGTEYSITLGSFDETALSLGSIRLMEGSYPQAENEIAPEEYIRYLLPEGAGVGSKIIFETPAGEKEFVICGFIENYSAMWTGSDVAIPGKNDYPAALLAEGAMPEAQVATDALLYLHTLNKLENSNQTILQISNEIGDLDWKYMVFNDATYWIYYPMMIYSVNSYKSLFTLLILLGSGVLLYIALCSHFRTYQPVAQTLEQLGASDRYVLLQLSLWSSILALCGIALGIILCFAFSGITQPLLQISINPLHKWPQMILVFAGVLVVAVLYYLFGIQKRKLWKSRKRQKEEPAMTIRKGTVVPLAAHHVRQNWKRMAGVGLLIVAMVTVLFCTQYDRKARLRDMLEGTPYLNVHSEMGELFAKYGDFEIASKNEYYDLDAVNALGAYAGILGIVKEYQWKPASLIFPDTPSEYYNQLQQHEIIDREAKEVTAIPEGIRAAREGYSFYVLDQWNTPYFKEAYPQVNIEEDLALGKAVMFSMPFETPGGTVSAITNRAFQNGDTLRFGMLEGGESSFEELLAHPETIQYREETLQLTQHYDQRFFLDTGYEIKDGWGITIVITEETARTLSFLNHALSFHVYMKPDISEAEYTEIEEAFYRIAMTRQGAMITNYMQEKEFAQRLTDATGVAYTVLFAVLSIFILVALFTIVYGNLLQRQRMFGILRATGYRAQQLFRTVWLELGVYWAFISLLTYLLAMPCVKKFSMEVTGTVISADGLWQIAAKTAVFSGGLLLIFTLLAWLITRSVFKKSISSCIRFAE